MTHEQRQELIHRPFFITYFGTSYPWGGVAVSDQFFYNGTCWAERPRPIHGETGAARGTAHRNIAESATSQFFSIIDPAAAAVAKAQEMV